MTDKPKFFDTHAHAHFERYGKDAAAMLERGRQAGVDRLITVGVSVKDSQKAVAFAQKHEGVWASVGAHPHDGADFASDIEKSLGELRQLIDLPKVVAIGEIGLDYHYDHAPRDLQKKAFEAQLSFAVSKSKPIIFHVRDAWDDFWPIFDRYAPPKGVIHSFSAGPKELEACLRRDLFVALNGIMTFSKDPEQLRAAAEAPLDKLLLETDAPFLTPAPFRGKICEVKHVVDTARFLTELRGESMEELAEATTKNALSLFEIE